jgi:two-component system sensor kinase FixL
MDRFVRVQTRSICKSSAPPQSGCAEREAMEQNVSILMPKPDQSQHYGYMTRYRASGERRL